jgi:hypothetical protein
MVDYHVDGRSLRLQTATTIRRGLGGLGAVRRFFHHNIYSWWFVHVLKGLALKLTSVLVFTA